MMFLPTIVAFIAYLALSEVRTIYEEKRDKEDIDRLDGD